MNYNKRLQELKRKYFPELKNKEVVLKRKEQEVFMKAFPFNKYIYYNENLMSKCPPEARDAAFIHELYHKLQFYHMNFIKRIIVFITYLLFQKVRIKIEHEAHRETIKRGFGKGIILLNNYVKSRVKKEVWKYKISKLFLSEKEVKRLIKK